MAGHFNVNILKLKYYIYILYSKLIDKYYIGQTYNIDLRLLRHNLKTTKYTKRTNDWKLVYSEIFETRADAMNREKYIKKMKSRKYIEGLITGNTA